MLRSLSLHICDKDLEIFGGLVSVTVSPHPANRTDQKSNKNRIRKRLIKGVSAVIRCNL